MKTCIYTRLYYEAPYFNLFIEHYFNLGFDKIIILKSDSNKINIPSDYKEKINIYNVDNKENNLLPIYTKIILKLNYDWVLVVDIDEFLFIKNYDNIKDFIKEKIKFNSKINIFYFRWGMVEKFDNFRIENLSKVLLNYKLFSNKHIKSMVKISKLTSIYHPHLCLINENPIIYFENNILNNQNPKDHKITKNSYKETILVHIHTRSINNLIIKSFTTKLGNINNIIPKQIKKKKHFILFINAFDFDNIKYEKILKYFRLYIGLKADLPFNHIKSNLINFNKLGYKINNYNNYLINYKEEKDLLERILINNNINIKNYYKIMNILSIYLFKSNYFLSIF